MDDEPTPGGFRAPVEGDVLAGKYRVERQLGRGGFGLVVAARHIALDEQVAVKILLPEAVQSQHAVQRFLREGRATIKIRSEHVVKVHDIGTLEGGSPYLVMEYLDGADLADLTRKDGPLAPRDAVDYLLQACEALAEAHVMGIVHRDLKPANLFLTRRRDGTPCVKVLDFGISKVSEGFGDTAITGSAAIMGSPKYMSPEQMRSTRNVDARTDVWALGVILYEVLSGKPPFDATAFPDLCVKVLQTEPAPLSSLRPDVGPAFDAVIRKCLAKDPQGRYSDVGALADALAPLGSAGAAGSATRIAKVLASTPRTVTGDSDDHVSPLAATVPSDAPPARANTADGLGVSTSRRGAGPRMVGIAVALAAVIGAGVLVYFVALRGDGPSAGAPNAAMSVGPTSAPSLAPPSPSPSVIASTPPSSSATASAAAASSVAVAPSAAPPKVAPGAATRAPATAASTAPIPRPSVTAAPSRPPPMEQF
jgi:serine/threonine-protein kinase